MKTGGLRTAGFEKHLDYKMDKLGYSQDQYELGYDNRRPTMRMTVPTSRAEMTRLADRLRPDFNPKVKGDVLVFMTVEQSSTVGLDRMDRSLSRELLAVARSLVGGGWGRFSEDLADVLEGQVTQNKRRTPRDIFNIIKLDRGIVRMMREEGMTDNDLREFLNDDYVDFVRTFDITR